MKFLSFTNIALYLLGILLAVSLVFNVIDHFKINSLTNTNTTLISANKDLKADVEQRDNVIKDQNAQILAAGAKASGYQDQLNNLNKQLNDQKTTSEKVIDQLKNQPKPKTCPDAINYLNNNSDVFKW